MLSDTFKTKFFFQCFAVFTASNFFVTHSCHHCCFLVLVLISFMLARTTF